MALTPDELEELRESFDYNDANEDGRIELEEFVSMLDELESGINRSEALVGFKEIDRDHDDSIDFGEFVAWWSEP